MARSTNNIFEFFMLFDDGPGHFSDTVRIKKVNFNTISHEILPKHTLLYFSKFYIVFLNITHFLSISYFYVFFVFFGSPADFSDTVGIKKINTKGMCLGNIS